METRPLPDPVGKTWRDVLNQAAEEQRQTVAAIHAENFSVFKVTQFPIPRRVREATAKAINWRVVPLTDRQQSKIDRSLKMGPDAACEPMTICANCKHCAQSRGPKYRSIWCLKSGKVDPVTGDIDYLSCKTVNDGNCKDFEQAPSKVSLWSRIAGLFRK